MQQGKSPGFVTFSFDADDWHGDRAYRFIKAVKAAVPASARSYDAETGTWTVAELFAPELRRIYEDVFMDKNQTALEL